MPSAADNLATAIREFHAEVGGDPSYRHVSGALRDAETELGRMPGSTLSDRSEEPTGDGERPDRPTSFRDAKERSRERLTSGGAENDGVSEANSPGGRRGDAAPKEDS